MQNGPLTGYEYRVYVNHDNVINGTVGPDKTIHTVTIFERPFAISVAAMNQAGVGDHCPSIEVMNASTCKSNTT